MTEEKNHAPSLSVSTKMDSKGDSLDGDPSKKIVPLSEQVGAENQEIMELDISNIQFSTCGYDENELVGVAGDTGESYASSTASNTYPRSFYQAKGLIKREKSKAQALVEKSTDVLRQVNKDLHNTDFMSNFNEEVEDISSKYQTYIQDMENKEREMAELRETYENKLRQKKKEYDEKIRGKAEEAEQIRREMNDLKGDYDKSLKKLMNKMQEMKREAHIRDSNYKIQTMNMTIEYSKKVAKLKDEIKKLQDENSQLRQELNKAKLKEKDRIIRGLEEKLRALQQQLPQTVTQSSEPTRTMLMDATGERS